LLTVLARDDVSSLRSHLSATGEPNFNRCLRVVSTGGEVREASGEKGRELSLLGLAAQFGAERCARFLVKGGASVGEAEVEAAFRGAKEQLMQLLCKRFPKANWLSVALEAVKSWNVAGLRWLLDNKISTLLPLGLVRLFGGACSSGSYSCGSAILNFSSSATSHLRHLAPKGVVWRVLCGGRASLESGQESWFVPDDSMAAGYSAELREWLPEATTVTLMAKHEGRDAASVNAFVDASKDRAKTLTFIETENGGSICGGYLDVAWVEDEYATDPGRRSFVFTLKNHLGVQPTKFAQKRDQQAALMKRGDRFYFGQVEAFFVWHGESCLNGSRTYEAPSQGPTLFYGGDGGLFRAARWELWEVC
jgi:hypothetical protein